MNDKANGKFVLPPLPYEQDALEPHISAETLSFHHGKHHAAYVGKLNELAEANGLLDKSLEEVIVESAKDISLAGLFNNAAQVWNHSFYWKCMQSAGGGKPEGHLLSQIEKDFGSFDKFVGEFKSAGMTQFGSGWAWLVWNGSSLSIEKTSNAYTPVTEDVTPLLTVDVWEHAYYLDYQNQRASYLDVFFESLVNWEFVSDNFESV